MRHITAFSKVVKLASAVRLKVRLVGAGAGAFGRFWLVAARASCGLWLCLSAMVASATAADPPAAGGSNLLSLAELRRTVSQQARTIQTFRIEGVVCAVVRDQKLLALQDASACVLLEVPALDETIQVGERVAVRANHCALTRSRFVIQLGTAPVVNNDGHHAAVVKTGQVFLETGWQPIRVTWFNGFGSSALQVEYEGPDIRRQRIPSGALWRKSAGGGAPVNFQPGLEFDAYAGDWFFTVPDFRRMTPVAQGVATNFSLQYSVRPENAALAFNGYLRTSNAGTYTFYLSSDDGGYLYVGNPGASCELTALGQNTVPTPRRFAEALANDDDHLWTELEGEVTFAAPNEQELDLELAVNGERVQLAVVEGASLFSRNLLHRRFRAAGILEELPDLGQRPRARLIVPGPDQLEMRPSATETRSLGPATNKVLTTVEEIRHLTPAQAGLRLQAKIRGVVIWSSPLAFVLQDATAGVYSRYAASEWAEQPRVGESWEIEGTTDPGDFSPVLLGLKGKFMGNAALPEPIRPTWDQLLNGSLDAEYVELRGALTEISPTEMTLLTSEGEIKIRITDDHPLPYLPAAHPRNRSYVDSIVRIRGCLTARWDKPTRQVRAGEISLSPGLVQIEEFAPPDPFELPTRKTADLLWFDPSASTLQRTKIKGQIVFARPGEYCLQDGATGLRLRTKQPLLSDPGDVVEAVGFPQVGGPSPILEEAQARVIGKLPLPAPVPIAAQELLNLSHDSTLVQLQAMLVSDRATRRERVLELQSGQNHFIARLRSSQPGAEPLSVGSQLQLTGVYYSVGGEQASGNLDAFQLRLNSPADIRLLQQPPWWTLRRALTIVAVLTGVLAIALVWISLLRRKVEERTAQLQKQIEERQIVEQRRVMEQERTRVAQDLHDELGAGLTEMGLLGDLVKNPAVPIPEKNQYLGQMTDTARSLVASLDEIVWAVNPRYDSVASLASYYTLFAQRFLDLAGVACRPHMPASFPEYPLDSKGRHGLFLAFKEALNNVVRHSGATEVSLKIEVGQGELVISVTDNGHGFDSATEAAGGEGLQGMRHRLQHLGGGCEIRSKLGSGTEVELRLPVGNHTL
jgi:signal transduction histidine kinase